MSGCRMTCHHDATGIGDDSAELVDSTGQCVHPSFQSLNIGCDGRVDWVQLLSWDWLDECDPIRELLALHGIGASASL